MNVLARSEAYLTEIGLNPAAQRSNAAVQDLLDEIEVYSARISELSAARMNPLGRLSAIARGQAGATREEIEEELELFEEELRTTRQDRETAIELVRDFFESRGLKLEGEPASWKALLPALAGASALGESNSLVAVWDAWQRQFGKGFPYEAAYAKRSRALFGTCLGAAGNPSVANGTFDWVIVDEAGRATPPELLVPLVRGRRAILVGDHRQLPPVLDRELPSEELDALGLSRQELERSLFQTLFETLSESYRVVLDTQYRMAPSIGTMISDVFYEGTIINGDHGFASTVPWPLTPLLWIDTSPFEDRFDESQGGSFRNLREVRMVRDVLERWKAHIDNGAKPLAIAVITGYEAQRKLLESELHLSDSHLWEGLGLELNTVDGFQGRERDLVIYSAVRSNRRGDIGFLSDARRLNVALSRAREHLVIIGDAQTLRLGTGPGGPNPFRRVLDWFRAHPEDAMVVTGAE